jgi:hypothetical protein
MPARFRVECLLALPQNGCSICVEYARGRDPLRLDGVSLTLSSKIRDLVRHIEIVAVAIPAYHQILRPVAADFRPFTNELFASFPATTKLR